MIKLKFPKSLRKYIRTEKARIRRVTFSLKEEKQLIAELYERLEKERKKKPVVAKIVKKQELVKADKPPH